MAKKSRKTPGARRPEPQPDPSKAEEVDEEVEEEEEDEAPAVAPPPSPSGVGLSPLVRSQEIELEIGLTLLGVLMGALTGYGQNVPMDAATGNLVGAIEAGAVGGMMGYSLGRTLFFPVRQQWLSWIVLVGLAVAGWFGGGLIGSVAGAGVGTALVFMGVFGSENDDVRPEGGMPAA